MNNNKVNLFIVLVAIVIASIFVVNLKLKPDINIIDNNRQIDSLNNVITLIEKEQVKRDSILNKYKDTVLILNSKIDSTKIKISKIHTYYGNKIKNVSNYNATELDSFITDRYKQIYTADQSR